MGKADVERQRGKSKVIGNEGDCVKDLRGSLVLLISFVNGKHKRILQSTYYAPNSSLAGPSMSYDGLNIKPHDLSPS